MTGFEVIVRPVVFPNIRPAPAQPLAPADDPEKGFATIRGNGAHVIGLSQSWSASTSSSANTETQRRVDTARVYQKTDAGKINRKNFVDIQVANKIWMKGPSDRSTTDTRPEKLGVKNDNPFINQTIVNWYKRATTLDNVEITDRDKIIKNEDAP